MRVSVIQMSPGSDKHANIAQATSLIEAVVRAEQPDLVVLPEVWTCLGGTASQKQAAAEVIPAPGTADRGGEAIEALRSLARSYRLFIHGGSMGELDGDRLLNTTVVIAPDGAIIGRYSKLHLFDITTPSGQHYRESDTYRAGNDVVTVPIEGTFGRIMLGLAICYDIRFPELFRRLREQGAQLLVVPAAFTAETGAAHWAVLLRARAIETQCWLAAAATTGPHEDAAGRTRQTFGHSMIIDPWGTIVAQASAGPKWATTVIDRGLLDSVRAAIPLMDHRRLG